MRKHDPKKTARTKADHHDKKVFDVRRPGRAPASPTSRPVITGHKAPVHDAQFVSGAPLLQPQEQEEDEKPSLLGVKDRKQITPVTEPVATTIPESTQEPQATKGVEEAEKSELPVEPTTAPAPVKSDTQSVPMAAVSPPTQPAPVSQPPQPAPPEADSELPEPVAPAGYTETAPQLEVEASERPSQAALEQPTSSEASAVPLSTPEPAAPSTEDPTPESLGLGLNDSSSAEEFPGRPIGANQPASPTTNDGQKSIEQLLSENGTPVLEPDHSPGLIISHHRPHTHSKSKTVSVVLLVLLLVAVLGLNILLDLGVLDLAGLPHTNLLGN